MAYETLIVETRDGVAVVTVNRPDKLNALSDRTMEELDRAFAALAEDAAVRGVILTACALVLALGTSGCEKTFQNMYDQPRYKPLAASPLWADGRASRPPVDGTIAHSEGTLADGSSGRLGAIEPEPARQSDGAKPCSGTIRSALHNTVARYCNRCGHDELAPKDYFHRQCLSPVPGIAASHAS